MSYRRGSTISLRDSFTGQEDQGPDFGLPYIDYGARQYSPALSRWLVPDPMGEKYYDVSPYVYCGNAPTVILDFDGRDPIYAKSFWGKVKKIGDDGKNSSGSYLVRGSIARKVIKATRAGEFYTGALLESKRVIHIPTGQLLTGVKHSYEDTKQSQKENGGHSLLGDVDVTRWDEGPSAKVIVDENGKPKVTATLRMFIINGENTMPDNTSNVKMWWHTHPDITMEGASLGDSLPSKADYNGQLKMEERGYKGNSFVIGLGSDSVTFFNKRSSLITVSWADFLRMGEQLE